MFESHLTFSFFFSFCRKKMPQKSRRASSLPNQRRRRPGKGRRVAPARRMRRAMREKVRMMRRGMGSRKTRRR